MGGVGWLFMVILDRSPIPIHSLQGTSKALDHDRLTLSSFEVTVAVIPSLLQGKEKLSAAFQGWSICQGCSKAFKHLGPQATLVLHGKSLCQEKIGKSRGYPSPGAKPTLGPFSIPEKERMERGIHRWKPLKFATSKLQGAFPSPARLMWLNLSVIWTSKYLVVVDSYPPPTGPTCVSHILKQLPHVRILHKFSSMTPPYRVPNVSTDNLRYLQILFSWSAYIHPHLWQTLQDWKYRWPPAK